jgi:hypothetical protein
MISYNFSNQQRRFAHLFIENFSFENPERMFIVLICKIVLRSRLLRNDSNENIININAWNKWNEQAVLEPNTITGYQVLDTIQAVIKDC